VNSVPWRWLWRGDLPADSIAVEFLDRPPDLLEPLRRGVEEHWRHRVEQKQDGVLFRGQMAQLLDHREEGETLHLQLARTDYAHWLFCSGRGGEIASAHGEAAVSRPLALCAAVITDDDQLVIQERSSLVAEGAGLIHVPGGHLDPDEHRLHGTPDPTSAMLAELEEELTLTPAQLTSGRLLGLIENLANGKPELLYSWRATLSAADLLARSPVARDHFEYSRLLFVPRDERNGFRISGPPEKVAIPCRALLEILSI
jgi:8-oxo-dGTP pyrophosphatase MutT (NUDIX family)